MVNYFWDSYAVIEAIDGNKNYSRYIEENVVTSIFNLAEIYWFALNEYEGKKPMMFLKNLRNVSLT